MILFKRERRWLGQALSLLRSQTLQDAVQGGAELSRASPCADGAGPVCAVWWPRPLPYARCTTVTFAHWRFLQILKHVEPQWTNKKTKDQWTGGVLNQGSSWQAAPLRWGSVQRPVCAALTLKEWWDHTSALLPGRLSSWVTLLGVWEEMEDKPSPRFITAYEVPQGSDCDTLLRWPCYGNFSQVHPFPAGTQSHPDRSLTEVPTAVPPITAHFPTYGCQPFCSTICWKDSDS